MSPRPFESAPNEFEAALLDARRGRFPVALDQAERALAESSRAKGDGNAGALAFSEIARLAERASDWSSAERALDRALTLRPRYADLHFRRGCVLASLKRRDEARQAFDRALELNPRYVAARVERAMLDAREGLVGEALEALHELSRDQAVEDPRTFQQGITSLERADWDAADSLLRRALNLGDERFEHELRTVRGALERGDAAAAVRGLRLLVPRFDAYPDLHALLGRAELALGHNDDALLALARALELNPDYHDARVLLAQALECVGQTAQAQEQVALVLQHEPTHVEALARKQRWDERHGTSRRRGPHE
jgi:tetratricopeptide (TPR) repeat protein